MGYDVDRFDGKIDEEFKCQICWGVLEDPAQISDCEHTFCKACINEWFKNSQSCPVDRISLKSIQLKPTPRIVRNIINHLQIHCKFESKGCNKVIRLEELEVHHLKCSFNPEVPIKCEKNCGSFIPKNKLNEHDCIKELRDLICNQQKQICELNQSIENFFNLLEKQREVNSNSMKKVMELADKCNHLESCINNLEGPIQKILIFANDCQKNLKNKNNEKENSLEMNLKTIQNKLARETTIEIYISNLNQQVNCDLLTEYLNNQDIQVINCKVSLSKGRFNDYRVTILKSAVEKILEPKIWPIGVNCFICGEFYSSKIEGTKHNINEFDLISSN